MRSASDPEIVGFEIVRVLDDARRTVFRARETASGRAVVVKLLDKAKEPVLPKRFDRSRRALSKLCSIDPGFVAPLEIGVSPAGVDYIVSPHYPTGSLRDQIEQGPLPWRVAAELISEVAEIVGNAHAASVVLGDLRPSSILLEYGGQPVVAAMGMATRRFDDGTPVFAAPESGDDRPRLTPAADVYSLALVFGALVAGHAKPRSQSDDEFLEELRALMPARFLDVIAHGLAAFPTNRYRDATTMGRAIRLAIEADPDNPTAVPTDEGSASFDLYPVVDGSGAGVGDPADGGASTGSDGLPPGLEDIVFAAPDESADPSEEVANLSLPAGLEDLKLVNGNGAPLDHHPNGRAEEASTGDEDDTTPPTGDESTAAIPFDGERDGVWPFDDRDGVRPFDDRDGVRPFDDRDGVRPFDDRDGVRPFDPTGRRALDRPDGDRRYSASPPTRSPTDGSRSTEAEPDDISLTESVVAAATTTLDHVLELDRQELEAAEAHADDPDQDDTTVLDLAALQETEDATSVFSFNDLSDDEARHVDVDHDAEDSPYTEHDHSTDEERQYTEHGRHGEDEDPTTVLDLDELDRLAALEAEPGFENGSDPEDTDHESVYGVNGASGEDGGDVDVERADDRDHPAAPAPPEPPIGGREPRSTASVVFSDDQTDIFGDSYDDGERYDDDGDRDGAQRRPAAAAAAGTLAAPFAGRGLIGEEIPFTGVSQVRKTLEPQTWLDKTRVAVEVAWFRSRRSMASMAAVLGLLAIAGIAIFFLAKEINSNVTEAEGVPLAPTTVTSSPNYVPTEAPYVTDPPQTHTTLTTATTAAPRRRATAAPTTDPAPPSTSPQSTSSASTSPTSAPATSPSTTVEVLPTTDQPPPTEPPPTSTKRRNTTTRQSNPSTTGGEATGTSAGSQSQRASSEQPQAAVAAAAVQAPDIVSLEVLAVQDRSASVRYASDQCVATRFTLSGADGTTQTGSSPGFDPDIRCSAAWNLDFKGSWRLQPGTAYSLQVWIKGRESGLTDSGQISFTTTN